VQQIREVFHIVEPEQQFLPHPAVGKRVIARLVDFPHRLLHLLQTEGMVARENKVVIERVLRSAHLEGEDVADALFPQPGLVQFENPLLPGSGGLTRVQRRTPRVIPEDVRQVPLVPGPFLGEKYSVDAVGVEVDENLGPFARENGCHGCERNTRRAERIDEDEKRCVRPEWNRHILPDDAHTVGERLGEDPSR
jgi:hypothetical protein